MRSSAISSALVNKLLADPTLMALTPDGVFFGVAKASMATGDQPKRFVIVSLIAAVNEQEFGRRAFQDAIYLVEARVLSASGSDHLSAAHAAAERIDALLDDGALTIPGYGLMALYQDEPTEFIEFDDADTSIQWDRCGGQYRLMAAPVTT